jgi:hypothetical protein
MSRIRAEVSNCAPGDFAFIRLGAVSQRGMPLVIIEKYMRS